MSSESPLFTWSVKHAQWLINRYMIGADGKTAYSCRWNREYNGSLCMFGELIDAKVPVSGRVRVPKAGSQWFSGVYLGKDTEADEVVLGNANGVFKVRTVRRRSPSQQWSASYVMQMTSTPWQPRGDGVESTAFVMPPDLGVKVLLDWSVLRKKKLKGMLSLKTWYLIGVRVSLSRTYCFKMAMIELLLKWIMKHLRRLENRQERVRGLIQMHLRLSRQLRK